MDSPWSWTSPPLKLRLVPMMSPCYNSRWYIQQYCLLVSYGWRPGQKRAERTTTVPKVPENAEPTNSLLKLGGCDKSVTREAAWDGTFCHSCFSLCWSKGSTERGTWACLSWTLLGSQNGEDERLREERRMRCWWAALTCGSALSSACCPGIGGSDTETQPGGPEPTSACHCIQPLLPPLKQKQGWRMLRCWFGFCLTSFAVWAAFLSYLWSRRWLRAHIFSFPLIALTWSVDPFTSLLKGSLLSSYLIWENCSFCSWHRLVPSPWRWN